MRSCSLRARSRCSSSSRRRSSSARRMYLDGGGWSESEAEGDWFEVAEAMWSRARFLEAISCLRKSIWTAVEPAGGGAEEESGLVVASRSWSRRDGRIGSPLSLLLHAPAVATVSRTTVHSGLLCTRTSNRTRGAPRSPLARGLVFIPLLGSTPARPPRPSAASRPNAQRPQALIYRRQHSREPSRGLRTDPILVPLPLPLRADLTMSDEENQVRHPSLEPLHPLPRSACLRQGPVALQEASGTSRSQSRSSAPPARG